MKVKKTHFIQSFIHDGCFRSHTRNKRRSFYVYRYATDIVIFPYNSFVSFPESSIPQKPNDKARLVSIIDQPDNGRCLEFWYHMLGANIGKLNVYVNTNISNNDTRTLLWSRGANVGDVWRKAHVATEYTVPFRVIFEGVVGNGIDVR